MRAVAHMETAVHSAGHLQNNPEAYEFRHVHVTSPLRYALVSKETYVYGIRDLLQSYT